MHTYPFTCALPPTLPSSFEGEWGFVRYTVKVTLDRPWKFDQDIKMAFTVISPVDLNLNPRVKDPFKLELEKKFCCFCCASGPLSLIVHVPVTGFVSGQSVPVTIECDNASNVGVEKITINLRKLLAFHVHTPRRETKRKKELVTTISMGPVEAGNSQTWQQFLQIPPLPPSNLVNCGIIDVDYDIKVVAEASGMHANLDGNIPIVLGTVPLESFQAPPPYTDNPPVSSDIIATETDPSMLPTQPVSPASPPSNGAGGALGWNVGDNKAYPNIRKCGRGFCRIESNRIQRLTRYGIFLWFQLHQRSPKLRTRRQPFRAKMTPSSRASLAGSSTRPGIRRTRLHHRLHHHHPIIDKPGQSSAVHQMVPRFFLHTNFHPRIVDIFCVLIKSTQMFII